MWRPLFFFLVLVCAAGTAQARTLTVAELQHDARRLDGQMVTVRGQIDSCSAWYCEICPEDVREQGALYQCLSVVFTPQGNHDFWHSGLHEEKLYEKLYRFATVTLTARFSAMCVYDANGNPVGSVVCSDGPAALDDAHVVAVHARKTAQTGLASADDVRPLRPATADEAAAMAPELNLSVQHASDMGPRAFFIAVHEKNDRPGLGGLGCVCLVDNCDGRWPVRTVGDDNGPGNPFICWNMWKSPAGWRVTASFF
jgi:hypothetical protein